MPTRITHMVGISTRYTHLSRAGISRRHLCRHTSLLGVHLSPACMSLENASYLYFTGVYLVRFHRLCISGLYISQGVRKSWGACISWGVHPTRCVQLMGACISWGVHLTGCAHLMGTCISWACISGRVSFAGMHLKGLHLIGVHLTRLHLRYLYLMGVPLACVLRLSSPYPNCVPGR